MTTTAATTPPALGIRLSVMMFLQYAIWGAWLPILYPFLLGYRQFSLDQVGMILAAGAIGAILGPFIAGQIADRHFNTERFLGVSHILGAAAVYILAGVEGFWPFFGISVVYGLVYAPTLALTNSLCFHHLTDRDRQFGPIRLWGTIGWIVAGIAMGQWLLVKHTPEGTAAAIQAAQDAGRADAFRLSAYLGVLMSIYCFTLPKTPPSTGSGESNATFEAIREVRRQPLVTLFLLAVPISMVHQFYFVHTSQFLSEIQNQNEAAQSAAAWINRILGVGGGGLMTIGQMSEIAVLALIPIFAKTLSRKALLGIGLLAYAARMALFAYVGDSMAAVLLGVAMHGLCFGCFIFVAFMVVDEECTADVRASAQNLFNLVIVGIGIIVGSWFATSIVGRWAMRPVLDDGGEAMLSESGAVVESMNYTALFSIPMWIALACFVVLVVLYPGKRGAVSGERGALSRK